MREYLTIFLVAAAVTYLLGVFAHSMPDRIHMVYAGRPVTDVIALLYILGNAGNPRAIPMPGSFPIWLPERR